MSRILVVLLLMAGLAVATEEKKAPPKLDDDEKAILDLTNKARAEKKLPLLKVNPMLLKAARAHSANMAKKGELRHDLDGKTVGDRVKAEGYEFARAGENIAVGEGVSLDEIFKGWMESKGHRENILQEDYQEIGLGIARNDKGEMYYAQVFGKPKE